MPDDVPENNLFEAGNFPTSLEPEEVLRLLIFDLKHLVNSLEGYTGLLFEDEAQETHEEAREAIPVRISRMKTILSNVQDYLSERKT